MLLLPMFAAFTIACAVIIVCFTKKQMKIARACFLALGIAIGTCSLLLILADWQFSRYSFMHEYSFKLNRLTTLLLFTSTLLFCVVIAIIAAATVILSVFAIRKIAEYIKSRKRRYLSAPGAKRRYTVARGYILLRKIFLVHCRWND